MEIRYTDDPSAPEKTREEVRPGNPYISFTPRSYVTIVADNPVPGSGLFKLNTEICDGDTPQQLIKRIAKLIGSIGLRLVLIDFWKTI